MAVITNPHVSSVHAATFSKEIRSASTLTALADAAKRHGDYLLGDDKTRLRDEYTRRLSQLKGHKP